MNTESLWHVTVLSNFLRAYDKYSRVYAKTALPESTYPDRFFLLPPEELAPGIAKAERLRAKLNLPGNRLLALRTTVPSDTLHPNSRTGIGRFVGEGQIRVDAGAWIVGGQLELTSIEEASALAFHVGGADLRSYDTLVPRSLSVLPVARGCQAACPFCFSDASASAEQDQKRLDLGRIAVAAEMAKQRGAERFVITGGGEPGLVRHELLCELISTGHRALGKCVLITNGHHLARLEEGRRLAAFADYHDAGLEVLAVSRHHHDDETSSRMMSLATDVDAITRTWRMHSERRPGMRLRFTCVLQRGGIEDFASLERYLDWTTALGVREICFKELYVSTSIESIYHRHGANAWSYEHQVPLSLVLDFARRHAFHECARLPWGSPVFRGEWRGRPLQFAAYTEPSLYWERTHGIARSWNLMADGLCLASLEDRASVINLPSPLHTA